MDSEHIEEIFAPVMRVVVRRMFGGHGIYADDLFFALESGGVVYLKVDAATQPQFEAAGSSPFVYQKAEKTIVMSFWRLVESAYDDEDELRRWASLALESARRAQAAKAEKAVRRRRR
ncbi:MAG: competence protein TfoX [Methylocystaceae bacterium]|nr:MAG: competence protein TfoX [Methylocystaceae bacterium]